MRILILVAILVNLSAAALGQPTVATLRFEVADVHVSAPVATNGQGVSAGMRAGQYELRRASMLDLIRTAWGVDADRVQGGPAWLVGAHQEPARIVVATRTGPPRGRRGNVRTCVSDM